MFMQFESSTGSVQEENESQQQSDELPEGDVLVEQPENIEKHDIAIQTDTVC